MRIILHDSGCMPCEAALDCRCRVRVSESCYIERDSAIHQDEVPWEPEFRPPARRLLRSLHTLAPCFLTRNLDLFFTRRLGMVNILLSAPMTHVPVLENVIPHVICPCSRCLIWSTVSPLRSISFSFDIHYREWHICFLLVFDADISQISASMYRHRQHNHL